MAKLTTKKRNALPKAEFALPASRKYPVNDKAHAANAKARASQMKNEGKISATTKTKIDKAANKELGKKSPAKPKAKPKKKIGY